MAKYWLIALLAIFELALFIEAAPRSLDAEQIGNLSAIADIEQPVRYDGAQLWSVDFSDDHTKLVVVNLKKNFDVSLWSINGTEVDVFVRKSAVEDVRQVLKENNIPYTVLVEDMQRQIEEENPPQSEIEQLQNRNGHRLTWRAYHRLSDIHSFLDYLVATYPDLCSLQTIGQSFEKRPLKVLKISNGNSKNKAIWIDGGIHAREWISPASVTYIVNDLVENWDEQPQHIRNINWYILSVHNPDGYEYTHRTDRLWRKNRSTGSGRCAGVDLNRNYGYKWGGKGTSQNTCSDIYSGRKGFSEPETAAVKRFFDNTKEEFYGFLTFHSYGQYILHPWGYEDVVPPDHKDLSRVGNEAALNMKAVDNQEYRVGPSAALLYPAAGGSDDWGKSIGIKYSYTIELRDRGRYGFVLPANYIEPTAKEARAFVFTISRAVAQIRRNE